jgi:hypothetical protein
MLCDGTHGLESCKKYNEMDVKTRKEFAKTKGLQETQEMRFLR